MPKIKTSGAFYMAEIEHKKDLPAASDAVHGLMKKALQVSESGRNSGSGLLFKITKSSQRNKFVPKAIVEQDGIFTIQENLETSSVQQNLQLKELVDSVLKR